MNPTVINGLAIGLLVSFGMVIGIAVVFATLYRRHLRALRMTQRWLDPLTPLVGSSRSILTLPMPHRWMAIRSSNTAFLREILHIGPEEGSPWSEALVRFRERVIFISPPWRGWSLVVGAAIPDPAADIDQLYRFLSGLSREVGEVQFSPPTGCSITMLGPGFGRAMWFEPMPGPVRPCGVRGLHLG